MKELNRIQSRLFQKNLEKFVQTFGRFSIYQLRVIRNLIDDIIERKIKNE